MPAPATRPCPSCREPMQVHTLPAASNGQVEIDFCFGCQGLWLDHLENLKLAPEGVATLFKAMHQHRGDAHTPLAGRLGCPCCQRELTQGFDVVKSGRYITHRCASRHGRFSSFASFMIEKGFVRQLTKPEIADIARKVGSIQCSNCGAPVDLRKEDACSHCRSALSLLDPQAVEKALQTYAKVATPARAPDIADALVALARERSRAQRTDASAALGGLAGTLVAVDLFSAGLSLLGNLWDD